MYEVILKDRKYTIRQADFSTDDYKHIQQLFYKYFPKSLVDKEMMKENNYIVAEYQHTPAMKPKIIAVTGLKRVNIEINGYQYNGYSITWSATNKLHRHHNLIYTMLKGLVDTLPEDLPIYCEAWRINQNQYPNMISTIKKLNMQLLEKDVDMTLSKKHLKCSECPYKVYTENPEDNCNCYSDIYILNRASQEKD